MDMDLDDLDSFIANIEQTAPQEDLADKQHKCQECDTVLEDVEGTYICPNCSAQATNILQLEETELHYDESGRAILGQRVNLHQRKSKQIEYGWAWSTDEAIVHILCEQLKALEKIGLIPRIFLEGTKNMWTKFWIENVAPHIKDEYNEDDFVEVKELNSLKTRDFEVLVKVQDKVMVPKRLVNRLEGRKKIYSQHGAKFTKSLPDGEELLDEESESSDEQTSDPTNRSLQITPVDTEEEMNIDQKDADEQITAIANQLANERVGLTKTLSRTSVSILTLNRTLAFIEATARCLDLEEPFFASDIIKACNERSIPFFGAHKILPEGMNLNNKDKALFQKTRPPSPIQLTRTAMMLLHRIYRDQLPKHLPVPNLTIILRRFIEDMNLPMRLLELFDGQVTFEHFKRTRPLRLHHTEKRLPNPPQYNRWGFAILVCLMKRYFNFDDSSVTKQAQKAERKSSKKGRNYFVLQEWIKQMSIRLQLIMSYDPFVMFHPMTDINLLQPNPQIYKYIECILNDRVISTTRSKKSEPGKDENYRNELSDFIKKEIPVPKFVALPDKNEEQLNKSSDIWHPIQDSFYRTRKFWINSISEDKDLLDIISKDFTDDEIYTLKSVGIWSIFDDNCQRGRKLEINQEWPYCFRLLLSVGAYLCYCQPQDLLAEIKQVDEFLYPDTIVLKKNTYGLD